MDRTKMYEDLAKHLDQAPIGAPMSPALLGLLEILFPEENEINVALKLPLVNKTLSELKTLYSDVPNIEDILDRMVKRGTVFVSRRPGEGKKYRLLPSVVGWAETPYWGGKDTPEARKMAPLWLRYREEAYAQEMTRGVPPTRVIPVSQTVQDPGNVLPFDALKPMVEATSYRAVGHCPCRKIKTFVGEGCDHSTENCLHFGSMARYMVEQDMAREITVEETLQILKDSNEEGLVHVGDNIEGHLATICNCCGCCCNFLATKNQMGLQTFSISNFVAQVDVETCAACGTCEERCPMGAIAVGDEEYAVVDADKCIGCGVCTPTCSTESVDLILRGEVKPPPTLEEFMTARLSKP
ncbi:MAG: 4Fe-4S binding protein [Desulfobacteraceae bacterium]|nr:4Fe-4S binding protein [Desulfobacteraceae bacterium]